MKGLQSLFLASVLLFTQCGAEEHPGAKLMVIYDKYRLSYQGQDKAYKALMEAANMGYTPALLELAMDFDELPANFDYGKYGASKEEARVNLLLLADPRNFNARRALAELYEKRGMLQESRKILQELSEKGDQVSWDMYAKMCVAGEGGPVDHSEGFVYYGALAATTQEGSYTNKQAWKQRIASAKAIQQVDLPKLFRRIDSLVGRDPRFFDEDYFSEEEKASADAKRNAHRTKEIEFRRQLLSGSAERK